MIHQILIVNVDVVTFLSTKSSSVEVSDVVCVVVVMVDIVSHSFIGRSVIISVPALVAIVMMMMSVTTISCQIVPVSSHPSALSVPATTEAASPPSTVDLALSTSRCVITSRVAITALSNPSAFSVPATRTGS